MRMKKMKLISVVLAGGLLLTTSCSSYTASGAMVGGEFGHVIGSAIGGISGGWRGHHVGSLIGTVGGVVAGAAIGAAVESAQNRQQGYDPRNAGYQPDESGYDPSMQGDDRIVFDEHATNDMATDVPPTDEKSISLSQLTYKAPIQLRKATITDADKNGVLTRGEECTVMFEVMNNTSHTIYDIYPLVEDVTGNKHVRVSPNLRIESIPPYQGIRYTATIIADKRLKDGEIIVRVGVAQGQKIIDSQTRQIKVPTRKKVEG